MVDLVGNNLVEISIICRELHVNSLLLSDSVTNKSFNGRCSDLDFLVEFNSQIKSLTNAENFFDLRESSQNLSQMDINLLSYRALKNKVIISEIERSKVELYAA